MSVESTIQGLKDVEQALADLSKAWNIRTNRFDDPQNVRRFAARKQQYKDLRLEAYRWLRIYGAVPEKEIDLERGWYTKRGVFVHNQLVDNPASWSVHAFRQWRQLQRVSASFVAQNIYLINQFMSAP